MRQRVMIAMALICEPKLLIADEPTTALDVTVQSQITDLLQRLSERTGTALLFISHDLGVVAETCTRMITMYAGEVVEDAPVDDVLIKPRHPYTSGLLAFASPPVARGAAYCRRSLAACRRCRRCRRAAASSRDARMRPIDARRRRRLPSFRDCIACAVAAPPRSHCRER